MANVTMSPPTAIVQHMICALTGALLAMQALGGSTATTIEHPVLDYGIDKTKPAQYEKVIEPIMGMSDEEMLAFVPPHNYISYCECPACYGGVEGNGVLVWSISNPEQLTCRFCKTVVFPNEKYPEDHTMVGENALGEKISLPYYYGNEHDSRHFFSGNLWKYKRQWLLQQCIGLGKAYYATGNEAYARRAVLVLDRFAQAYPHYPALHNRHTRNIRFCKSQEPPYSWDAGRWGYFHCEIPKSIITIYDLVCESPEFDRLSQERGYDVRTRLEDDFLRETYRIAAASKYIVSNVVGYDIAGVATLGRVLNEPTYVHQAFRWMMRNVNEGFFRDGLWSESPSYHYMTIGGLKSAFNTIRGHSDPPEYIDAVDGTRFDNFEPFRDVPFLAVAADAPSVLDFPTGCSTAVHDTWPNQVRSKPREKTVSTIAPAYGHASLGRGTKVDQMQAQLHFSGAFGHSHRDNLSMCLFAKGKEVLPDIGYTWTQMRAWTISTVGHNTVVIDRENQNGGGVKSSGDLLRFFPNVRGFSLVDADGQRGYVDASGPDSYRRTLLMVPVSDNDAYVVDLFRIRGGHIHDWAMHGDADEDMTASCTESLQEIRKSMLGSAEEKDWKDPNIITDSYHPYGMIRDAASAIVKEKFSVDFRYDADPSSGVRMHLDAGNAEIFLGRAPSVRRMGTGTNGDMRKAYDFWMPQLLVRRTGSAQLTSTFAVVEEPFAGEPFLANVERLPIAFPGAIALRVTHAAGIDTIVSMPDSAKDGALCTVDGVTLRGMLGIVRRKRHNGPVIGARLFEGTNLSCGPFRLECEHASLSGRVLGVQRKLEGAGANAFVVDTELPTGQTLHGIWMILTQTDGTKQGYEIDAAETSKDGKTRIILTRDSGLTAAGAGIKEVYFPRRTFEELPTFTIPLSIAYDREE